MRCIPVPGKAYYSIHDLLCDVHDMWAMTNPSITAKARFQLLLAPDTVKPAPARRGAAAKRVIAQPPQPLKALPLRWCIHAGYLIVGEASESLGSVMIRLHNAWSSHVLTEIDRWSGLLGRGRTVRLGDVPSSKPLQLEDLDEAEVGALAALALDVAEFAGAQWGETIGPTSRPGSVFAPSTAATKDLADLASHLRAQEFGFTRTIRDPQGNSPVEAMQWAIGHGGHEMYPSPSFMVALQRYGDDRRRIAAERVGALVGLLGPATPATPATAT